MNGYVKQFKIEKWENVQDKERSGWSSNICSEETLQSALHIVKEDRYYTINEIFTLLDTEHWFKVSHNTISQILTEAGLTKLVDAGFLGWASRLATSVIKFTQKILPW